MAIVLLVRPAGIFSKKEYGYDHTVTNAETKTVSMAESVSPGKHAQHFDLGP
jgi:hypothetical protein